MARSYRRNPIMNCTTGSDTFDRRASNKAYRARVRVAVRTIADFDAEVLPELGERPGEANDTWGGDGRRYFGDYIKALPRDEAARFISK